MKITIIQKREVEFKTREQLGDMEMIKGFMYGGFLEDGKAIEFFSQEPDLTEIHNVGGYVEKLSVDLPIRLKIFNGKVKYSLTG